MSTYPQKRRISLFINISFSLVLAFSSIHKTPCMAMNSLCPDTMIQSSGLAPRSPLQDDMAEGEIDEIGFLLRLRTGLADWGVKESVVKNVYHKIAHEDNRQKCLDLILSCGNKLKQAGLPQWCLDSILEILAEPFLFPRLVEFEQELTGTAADLAALIKELTTAEMKRGYIKQCLEPMIVDHLLPERISALRELVAGMKAVGLAPGLFDAIITDVLKAGNVVIAARRLIAGMPELAEIVAGFREGQLPDYLIFDLVDEIVTLAKRYNVKGKLQELNRCKKEIIFLLRGIPKFSDSHQKIICGIIYQQDLAGTLAALQRLSDEFMWKIQQAESADLTFAALGERNDIKEIVEGLFDPDGECEYVNMVRYVWEDNYAERPQYLKSFLRHFMGAVRSGEDARQRVSALHKLLWDDDFDAIAGTYKATLLQAIVQTEDLPAVCGRITGALAAINSFLKCYEKEFGEDHKLIHVLLQEIVGLDDPAEVFERFKWNVQLFANMLRLLRYQIEQGLGEIDRDVSYRSTKSTIWLAQEAIYAFVRGLVPLGELQLRGTVKRSLQPGIGRKIAVVIDAFIQNGIADAELTFVYDLLKSGVVEDDFAGLLDKLVLMAEEIAKSGFDPRNGILLFLLRNFELDRISHLINGLGPEDRTFLQCPEHCPAINAAKVREILGIELAQEIFLEETERFANGTVLYSVCRRQTGLSLADPLVVDNPGAWIGGEIEQPADRMRLAEAKKPDPESASFKFMGRELDPEVTAAARAKEDVWRKQVQELGVIAQEYKVTVDLETGKNQEYVFRAKVMEVTDLPPGISAWRFHEDKDKPFGPLIVVVPPLPVGLTETERQRCLTEAAFHEYREGSLLEWRLDAQRAHSWAAREQILAFSNGGRELTPQHRIQLEQMLPEKLLSLIIEYDSGRIRRVEREIFDRSSPEYGFGIIEIIFRYEALVRERAEQLLRERMADQEGIDLPVVLQSLAELQRNAIGGQSITIPLKQSPDGIGGEITANREEIVANLGRLRGLLLEKLTLEDYVAITDQLNWWARQVNDLEIIVLCRDLLLVFRGPLEVVRPRAVITTTNRYRYERMRYNWLEEVVRSSGEVNRYLEVGVSLRPTEHLSLVASLKEDNPDLVSLGLDILPINDIYCTVTSWDEPSHSTFYCDRQGNLLFAIDRQNSYLSSDSQPVSWFRHRMGDRLKQLIASWPEDKASLAEDELAVQRFGIDNVKKEILAEAGQNVFLRQGTFATLRRLQGAQVVLAANVLRNYLKNMDFSTIRGALADIAGSLTEGGIFVEANSDQEGSISIGVVYRKKQARLQPEKMVMDLVGLGRGLTPFNRLLSSLSTLFIFDMFPATLQRGSMVFADIMNEFVTFMGENVDYSSQYLVNTMNGPALTGEGYMAFLQTLKEFLSAKGFEAQLTENYVIHIDLSGLLQRVQVLAEQEDEVAESV